VKDKDQGYIAGPAQDITQKGAFAAEGFFDSLTGKDLTYDSNDDRHCVTKANEAVIASGFKGNLYNALSTEQKEAMNVANVYGTFAYDNPITKSLKDLSNSQVGQTRTLNRDAITEATKAELERRGIDFVSDLQLQTITKVTLDKFGKPMENGLINQVSPEVLSGYMVDAIEATAPVHTGSIFAVKKDKIENSVAQSIANTQHAQTNTPSPTAPKRAPSSVPPVTRTNLLTGLRTVTVHPGDTVSQLAQSLGTSVQGIMNVNPQITNPDKINAGASLAVPAPTAPRPQIAAPLPPRKPTRLNLLTTNHNLSVLNIPDKTAPITISGVPLGATITTGVGNQIPTKKHRNKGFETGLIGLGMSPENAKNAIAATQPELNMTSPQHFEASLARMNGILSGRPLSQKTKPNQVTTPTPTNFNIGMVIDRNITARMMAQRAKNTLSAEDKAFAEEATRGFYANTYKDNVPGPVREGAWQEPSRAAAIQEAKDQAKQTALNAIQKRTDANFAAIAKADDVKAARLATNTMPTTKIEKADISVDLSQFTSIKPKQETLGQKSLLGSSGLSPQEKGAPGLGRATENNLADVSKSFSNLADHGKIDAARSQRRRDERSGRATTSSQKGRTGGTGNLSRSGHLSGVSNDDGTTQNANPNQTNQARNKDGSYSLDKDGNGAGNAGGTVICTELYHQDLLPLDVYMADQRYGLHLERTDPYVIAGYHFWAKPVVRLMQCSKIFTHALNKSLAEPWAKEMVIKDGGNGIGTVRGKILFALGLPVCRQIGRMLEFVADKDRSVHSCSQREQEN